LECPAILDWAQPRRGDHVKHIGNSRKKYICTNCGKIGHEFKVCTEPITSFGIINVKVIDDSYESFVLRENFSSKKNDDRIITSKKYPNIRCSISSNVILENKNLSNQKML